MSKSNLLVSNNDMSRRPIKVLVICRATRSNFNVYRPEAAQLAGIQKTGTAEITVITNKNSVCVSYFQDKGIQVLNDPLNKKVSLSTFKYIRKELIRGRYDVLHLINNTAISNGSLAAIGLAVKVVAYRGQTGNTSRWSLTSYLSVLNPRIDMIIAVAQAVEKYLVSEHWNINKVKTVYKGHDLEWYKGPPADLSFLNLPKNAIKVCLVADIRPRKGLHVLMNATHYLNASNIHILLVGADPMDPEVKKQINKAAKPKFIHALGYRKDAPEISAACDIMVLPTTKREGLSRAILEGMAYGKPAVVTNTGGNAELVVHNQTGLVVPPNNPIALGEAINKLAASSSLRIKYGLEAKKRLKNKFSVEQGVYETLDVYKNLLR
ncbi:MAG: glycosyltransferase [Pseudomonadota bacterium]|nr:glycosyltransferase [Pseudomonadota bacterium]